MEFCIKEDFGNFTYFIAITNLVIQDTQKFLALLSEQWKLAKGDGLMKLIEVGMNASNRNN